MQNIIYIGKFFPKHIIETINVDSRGKIGMSNHNFEMSIINGLCQQDNITLRCLTIPGVYSFPYNNKRLFTKKESYDYKSTHITSIGFCNLPILKEIWATFGMCVQILHNVSQFDSDKINIVINTPDNRLLNAVRCAKYLTRKHLTQTVIIPDIPSMIATMGKKSYIKRIIFRYLDKKAMSITSQSDGLVLLTESMMDFIERPLPHIVMEGIADLNTMNLEMETISSDKEIILYTGTLRKIFGVTNLIEAFYKVKEVNVELWICGSGDSKEYIEDAAKKDQRIKFWGLVDSRTALEMQHQATILINPRTSVGEYTKYSFPSKTMEYLLAGKSVIINRLPGIPEEYYQYVYTPKDESISALTNCISDILALNKRERKEKAMKGKEFIIKYKNSEIQTSRVLELIRQYE